MNDAKITPNIIKYGHIESTNKKAREFSLIRATEGTVIMAKSQSGGRGSGNKGWHSPLGGLYLSALLYPKGPEHLTDLSILAGAAVSQSVQTLLPKAKEVSVKWPNDCLVGGKKIGGILCESLGEKHNHLCVVGIGVNVEIEDFELEQFEDQPFSATSFLIEGGDLKVEEVARVLLKKLFSFYSIYQEEGFLPIQAIWERNCRMIGKKIELSDTGVSSDNGSGDTYTGTFLGIDENGALVLSGTEGERKPFRTGSITCFSQ